MVIKACNRVFEIFNVAIIYRYFVLAIKGFTRGRCNGIMPTFQLFLHVTFVCSLLFFSGHVNNRFVCVRQIASSPKLWQGNIKPKLHVMLMIKDIRKIIYQLFTMHFPYTWSAKIL